MRFRPVPTTDDLDCVATPALTEGPYFVDELLNRSDVRSDPSTGVIQDGTILRLSIRVSGVTNGNCSPLEGAQVDIWHCNAEGKYSDVSANRTVGQKFLRGYQVTDATGDVAFTTIFPGWYSGRAVHIHFKVRSGNLEFTSQWFFDPDLTEAVLATGAYAANGSPDTPNSRDNIYTPETILDAQRDGDELVAEYHIGVALD